MIRSLTLLALLISPLGATARTATDGVLSLQADASGAGPVTVRDAVTDAFIREIPAPIIPPEVIWDVSVDGDFGYSVDIDSPLAVIGTPAPFDVGRAFVYDALTGDLVRTLVPTGDGLDGRTRPRFGREVRIDNDLIAVAAPNAFGGDGGELYVGAVYLYAVVSGDLIETYRAPDLTDQLPDSTFIGSDLELTDTEVRIQWSDYGTTFGWLSFPRPVPVPEPTTAWFAMTAIAFGGRRQIVR